MQDHGFVYFMLFTLWAVSDHFRSYLATIIAVVVKENSDTPSACICISISIADHITDIRIRIIRVRIRIIKMSDESQSSFLHEIKKTLRLICHRCLFSIYACRRVPRACGSNSKRTVTAASCAGCCRGGGFILMMITMTTTAAALGSDIQILLRDASMLGGGRVLVLESTSTCRDCTLLCVVCER